MRLTLFAGVLRTRANAAAAVDLRSSVVLEAPCPRARAELVSVKIIPNAQATPPGKLADAEVIFEAKPVRSAD